MQLLQAASVEALRRRLRSIKGFRLQESFEALINHFVQTLHQPQLPLQEWDSCDFSGYD